MISSEFKKEEYWLIKWPLCSLVLSLVCAGTLLFGLSTIDAAAADELRRARNDLSEARDRVDKIEEEEQTIIEYSGRYRMMEQDGVVAPEDRLQFQERLQDIRSEHDLWPVPFSMEAQQHLALQYRQGRTERGKEIVLNTSRIDISLPLLHEDDLARLLDALMDGPGILQPLQCSLRANSARTTNYIYLAQHFNGACTLQLYTFQLPAGLQQGGAQ